MKKYKNVTADIYWFSQKEMSKTIFGWGLWKRAYIILILLLKSNLFSSSPHFPFSLSSHFFNLLFSFHILCCFSSFSSMFLPLPPLRILILFLFSFFLLSVPSRLLLFLSLLLLLPPFLPFLQLLLFSLHQKLWIRHLQSNINKTAIFLLNV